MNRILNEIDSSLSADRPVYVHCWGGKGRTGAVVGLLSGSARAVGTGSFGEDPGLEET